MLSHINKVCFQPGEASQLWMCVYQIQVTPLKWARARAFGADHPPPQNPVHPPLHCLRLTPCSLTPNILSVTVVIQNTRPPTRFISTPTPPPPNQISLEMFTVVCLLRRRVGAENKDQKDGRDASSLLNQHGSCFIIHVDTHGLVCLANSLNSDTHTSLRGLPFRRSWADSISMNKTISVWLENKP